MRTNNGLALGFVVQEAVNFGNGTIECDDCKAMIGGIKDQVLA